MIARIWHGATPTGRADAYLELMRTVALPDYKAVPGNRGAWCLRRAEGDQVHVLMLTLWDDMQAVCAFAGDDPGRAKYYDFDPDFLIEMEPGVEHYEVFEG